MQITTIKTHQISETDSLFDLTDKYVPKLSDNSILAVTSKVVSLCEKRVKPVKTDREKLDLINNEADWYIKNTESKYNVTLTIKDSLLIANSGIDESNGNGKCILWPKDPFGNAKMLWKHLKERHKISSVGVIITDSRITPLRWGTIGVGIAWCGFEPLHDYRGKPDIFGRPLKFTQASIVDGLAASAVVAMGEGNEQTPLAIIADIPFVTFTNAAPADYDVAALQIDPKDDLFAPLLTQGAWKKGGA